MLYLYITYFIPASLLIPITFALVKYKSLLKPFKVLFWFLIFSLVANTINIIVGTRHLPTVTIFHIYTIFEFSFVSYFYSCLFRKKWGALFITLVSVFTMLCIIDFFFLQTGIQVDTYTSTLEAVIIITYCVLFMNQQNNLEHDNNWGDNALNWVNISFLMYYGCGLFMFISTNYLLKASRDVNIIVWSVFDTIMLFEYLLFAVGFYKCKK